MRTWPMCTRTGATVLRVRLYKTSTTYDGFPIEVTLLDTPLDPARWNKREAAEFDRLEQMALAKGESES